MNQKRDKKLYQADAETLGKYEYTSAVCADSRTKTVFQVFKDGYNAPPAEQGNKKTRYN
ncbi:MAG: hypothetical protein BWY09_02517 [Candidatus Hydrogenedentes bacterium ADurb.Bin179]|nr:MAG: hypothetical protein BWY09_02517 [Candidatus Hydrogenedentes bacterium ADurb.Bin179]